MSGPIYEAVTGPKQIFFSFSLLLKGIQQTTGLRLLKMKKKVKKINPPYCTVSFSTGLSCGNFTELTVTTGKLLTIALLCRVPEARACLTATELRMDQTPDTVILYTEVKQKFLPYILTQRPYHESCTNLLVLPIQTPIHSLA
jgi:hypothetical protein